MAKQKDAAKNGTNLLMDDIIVDVNNTTQQENLKSYEGSIFFFQNLNLKVLKPDFFDGAKKELKDTMFGFFYLRLRVRESIFRTLVLVSSMERLSVLLSTVSFLKLMTILKFLRFLL